MNNLNYMYNYFLLQDFVMNRVVIMYCFIRLSLMTLISSSFLIYQLAWSYRDDEL